MIIGIDLDGMRRTKLHEYAVRFVFGGLITAAAGLIAHRYGPGIGGLFLSRYLPCQCHARGEARKPEKRTRRPGGCHSRARSSSS